MTGKSKDSLCTTAKIEIIHPIRMKFGYTTGDDSEEIYQPRAQDFR